MTFAPRNVNNVLAWVNFTSAGDILTSFNVESVIKNSVGNFTVNFLNSFASANYSASFQAVDDSGLIIVPKLIAQDINSAQVQFRGGLEGVSGIVNNDISDPSIGVNMIATGLP